MAGRSPRTWPALLKSRPQLWSTWTFPANNDFYSIKRDKHKRDGRVDWLLLEGRTGADESLIGVQRPSHPVGAYVQHPLSPLSSKPVGSQQGTVHAQIVRSSDDWSSGILLEHSIQQAYKEVRKHAFRLPEHTLIEGTNTAGDRECSTLCLYREPIFQEV